MFKLPDEQDFFTKTTKVVIPADGGKYIEGFCQAKFKYVSQDWLDRYLKDDDKTDLQARADQLIEEQSEEDQKDLIRDIVHGFSDIQIGEHLLNENDSDDWALLFETGKYSLFFRIAFIQAFFKAVTGARQRMNKRGN